MVANTSAFGANENIDTLPTSRYVFRCPFSWGGAVSDQIKARQRDE